MTARHKCTHAPLKQYMVAWYLISFTRPRTIQRTYLQLTDNLTNLLKGKDDLVLGSCTIFFSILTLAGSGSVLLRLLKAVCDEDDMAHFLVSFAVFNRRSGF